MVYAQLPDLTVESKRERFSSYRFVVTFSQGHVAVPYPKVPSPGPTVPLLTSLSIWKKSSVSAVEAMVRGNKALRSGTCIREVSQSPCLTLVPTVQGTAWPLSQRPPPPAHVALPGQVDGLLHFLPPSTFMHISP